MCSNDMYWEELAFYGCQLAEVLPILPVLPSGAPDATAPKEAITLPEMHVYFNGSPVPESRFAALLGAQNVVAIEVEEEAMAQKLLTTLSDQTPCMCYGTHTYFFVQLQQKLDADASIEWNGKECGSVLKSGILLLPEIDGTSNHFWIREPKFRLARNKLGKHLPSGFKVKYSDDFIGEAA